MLTSEWVLDLDLGAEKGWWGKGLARGCQFPPPPPLSLESPPLDAGGGKGLEKNMVSDSFPPQIGSQPSPPGGSLDCQIGGGGLGEHDPPPQQDNGGGKAGLGHLIPSLKAGGPHILPPQLLPQGGVSFLPPSDRLTAFMAAAMSSYLSACSARRARCSSCSRSLMAAAPCSSGRG